MIFKHEKVSLTAIGELKHFTSAEIGESGISIGFECLDREMFDPEKCYDLLGESGMKWARCQTGWNRCETVKGVYDFAWLAITPGGGTDAGAYRLMFFEK